MRKINVHLRFIDEALGTSSANKEIYSDYIASKAPDAATKEDEVASFGAEAVAEKGTTVFQRLEDGTPYMYDYQVKGAFKEACGMLRRATGTKSSKVKAFKKEIDGLVFVSPRRIRLVIPEGGEMGVCERPLRAATPQGERIALARSETVPAGTTMDFSVTCLNDATVPVLVEWLQYFRLHGLSQWRNAGKGRAVVTVSEGGKVIYDNTSLDEDV